MVDVMYHSWEDGIGPDVPYQHWTDRIVMQHLSDARCPYVHGATAETTTCPTLLEFERIRRESTERKRERGW